MKVQRILDVREWRFGDQKTLYLGAVQNINELEYVEGFILANIWLTNHIAVISPVTGSSLNSLGSCYAFG